MLGGLIEYASLVVGYRALIVVAAVLYLAAMACAFRYRAKQRAPAVAAC
jgi:hypothetical protein